MKTHVRWMIRRDMAEVLSIERGCFGDHAWFEEEFMRYLRTRNVIGLVAEHGERVVAFVIYECHKTRLHVLNFAVHPDCQRQGVGRQIVEKLLGKLGAKRLVRITLEIRETNVAAQLFFHAMGFRAVTVLRTYYHDSGEDGYLFQYRVGAEVHA